MQSQSRPTASPTQAQPDLRATAALLRDTFPIPAFVGDAYLRWLYHENPHGRAIVGDIDDDDG